jgi:hypothetical protein
MFYSGDKDEGSKPLLNICVTVVGNVSKRSSDDGKIPK